MKWTFQFFSCIYQQRHPGLYTYDTKKEKEEITIKKRTVSLAAV